ncbi:zf-HC2 domain-containing protein [Nocardiopsis mangrovi]|uniref:Zf-HC2 domain-containing protein n=1 Tax=Nocardiopsis mangrovi TaxID=1179818 RepID=A0ABV9DSQ5_9ACTN
MTTDGHGDARLLGAYALGTLDQWESLTVEDHVASCALCREELGELLLMKERLGDLPPEALLDGPPDNGDLMLQRTLRRVRREQRVDDRRRATVLTLVAASAAVVLVVGGAVVGRAVAPDAPPVAAPPASPSAEPPSGTVVASGDDPTTGARATVQVTPADGWVRVNAAVTGIPQGEECRVIVVAEDGTREVAGSWLVSGEEEGTNMDGSALVDPEDVTSVVVENVQGDQFVEVPI